MTSVSIPHIGGSNRQGVCKKGGKSYEWEALEGNGWVHGVWTLYPYGYRAKHDGKGNRMVAYLEEAKIVQEIFTMFVDECLGTGKIARILAARDIGNNIDNRIVEGEQLRTKIHKNLFRQGIIRDILRNTTYT